MLSRRNFLTSSAVVLVGAAMVSGRSQAAAIPEAPKTDSPAMQPPLMPANGQDYQPVVTLNGWTLPWRMNGEWKEFHLVAEPVVREIAPGMKANLWGYNGQTPGPDHRGGRGRQGAHLRHQQAAGAYHRPLARHAAAERHGRRRRADPAAHPGGQDLRLRVRSARKSGTFMYHPHSDEMVQMAMGMMGMFVVHPKDMAVPPRWIATSSSS